MRSFKRLTVAVSFVAAFIAAALGAIAPAQAQTNPTEKILLLAKPSCGWMPIADGKCPTLFADFTTEGSTNHYRYNNTNYSSASAWISALGGTFSRSSTAYYTGSDGLLHSAANNTLRFDYDPITLAPKGILLEGSRTNTLLQSNAWSTSPWATNAASISQNASGVDGTTSAWTITATGTSLAEVYQTGSFSAGGCVSFYVKAGTSAYAYIITGDSGGGRATWFSLSGSGAVGTTNTGALGSPTNTHSGAVITAAPNGFFRISVVSSGAPLTYIALDMADANGSTSVTVGHTMIGEFAGYEPGSFASSYIPTTTTSVTRAADALTAGALGGVLSGAAGTIVMSGDVVNLTSGISQTFLSSNGSGNDQLLLSLTGSTGLSAYNGSFITGSPLAFGGGGFISGYKIGARWDASGRSIIAGNGSIASDTGNFSPATATSATIGAANAGSNNVFGHFKSIIGYPNKISDIAFGSLTQ